jgi:hypothetical protein
MYRQKMGDCVPLIILKRRWPSLNSGKKTLHELIPKPSESKIENTQRSMDMLASDPIDPRYLLAGG